MDKENKQLQNISPPSSTQLTQCPLSQIAINGRVKDLFLNFAAVYGHRWASSISDPKILDKTAAAWETAIADLTSKQLKTALQRISVQDEWVSIAAFRKAALGVLRASVAWELRETDPLAREVWLSITSFDRKMRTEHDLREIFIARYDIAADKLLTRS